MQVEATCNAVAELQTTLSNLKHADEQRHATARTEVENYQSQLKHINARRQFSQDAMEARAIY